MKAGGQLLPRTGFGQEAENMALIDGIARRLLVRVSCQHYSDGVRRHPL
jgi:hypothetical protein